MKKKFLITSQVHVSVDETKFTPQFMSEFKESFYPFESIEEHLSHLAQMHARGLCDDHSFIEGYGQAQSMGIKFSIVSTQVDCA